jgi:hypothetical protein
MMTDRLQAVADELARVVQETPVPPGALPPKLAAAERLARMAGIDPLALARSMTADSLRSFPSLASADPARADAWLAYVRAVLAWVAGEADEPPAAPA